MISRAHGTGRRMWVQVSVCARRFSFKVLNLTHEPTTAFQLTTDTEAMNPAWDAFVESTAGGHHAQTSMWAQVKSVLGWDSVRFVVNQGEVIVGGVQLLTRDVGRLGRVGFAPRGPLLTSQDPRLLDELLAAIVDFGRTERIRYLKIQPPTDRQDLVAALQAHGWSSSALEAAPTATIRINLEPPADEILARMRRSTRQNVRRAERAGLRVRVGCECDLAAYWALIEATSSRQGFVPYPARYYETMWRVFAAGGRARLLMAELDGCLWSSTLLVGFADSVTTKMSGWSGARGVSPNESMHWSGMLWAKECGYRWYDFDGVSRSLALALRSDADKSESGLLGVAGFKLGFGGEVALFPEALDTSPHAVLRPVVRVAAPHLDRARSIAHSALGRGA